MGTPEFAVQTLEVLAKSEYQLECVYTQPPKKSSRGQKLNATPVQIAAERLHLKIKTPVSLNNESDFEYFKFIKPYIVIVVAHGQIIPKKYLDLSKKGFINIHASLLPKWRGAAPIQRSIMNLEKETGISFMKIEEGLDTGPFMSQIKIKINKETNSLELSNKLAELGAKNILKCLDIISNNKEKFIKQDNSKATYAKKIEKSESKIIWNEKADKVLAKINGLNPTPGAWFEHKKIRYKIFKAEISNLSGEPGEVLNDSLSISCKDQSINILEIQKEGKKKLMVKEFTIGGNISKGEFVN